MGGRQSSRRRYASSQPDWWLGENPMLGEPTTAHCRKVTLIGLLAGLRDPGLFATAGLHGEAHERVGNGNPQDVRVPGWVRLQSGDIRKRGEVHHPHSRAPEAYYGGRPAYVRQVRSHITNLVQSLDLKKIGRSEYCITAGGRSRINP